MCYAAASVHPEKGTAIFYLLRRALEKGRIDTRVLELLAPHFSDCFPNENWMIYDKKRQKVLAHEQGGECTVYIQAVLNTQETDPVQSDEYENLWKAFCSHITIPERKNPGLQRQFVPLKFRSNMPEFS